MRKRLTTILVLATLLTTTGVFGYAVVTYIMERTTTHTVYVGNTVISEDGLNVTLATADEYNLTYFEVAETDTDKHYLTYTFNYEITLSGYKVTDDIVIDSVTYGDVITIVFCLNQEKDFTTGQELLIQFHFTLEQVALGQYTTDNPLDINTATQAQLEAIGFTTNEASNTIYARSNGFTDLDNLAYRIGAQTLLERYGEYAEYGVIVFN